MKIKSKEFRVRKGDDVDLGKWPTKVDPAYKSKEQYRNLLDEHVAHLSELQHLHYASNRYAVLLIFQAMVRREKMARSAVIPGSIRRVARCSASSIPALPNCNTIFSGARLATCLNVGGSAFSTDPITRKC